jgi:hypothetical protein
VAIFFLNCTKNTELTHDHFARTVTFALTTISKLIPAATPVLDRIEHFKQQHNFSGRHMKSEEWKTYRTRFLVNAKQLNSSFSFVDHLGRQHLGRKGDYLVESSDGVVSIAPRGIFEDVYVPISQPADIGESQIDLSKFGAASAGLNFEALEIEEVKLPKSITGQPNVDNTSRNRRPILSSDGTAPVRRKLPQPCRDRRGSTQHLRLM